MNTMFLDSGVSHANHDDNRPTAVMGHYAPSSPVVAPIHMSQLPMKYAPAPAAPTPVAASVAPAYAAPAQPLHVPSAPVAAKPAIAAKPAVKARVPLSMVGMLLVPAAMLVVSGGMAVQSLLELF